MSMCVCVRVHVCARVHVCVWDGQGGPSTLSCGTTLSIFCQVWYLMPRSRAKSR